MFFNSITRIMLSVLFSAVSLISQAQLYGTSDRNRDLLQGPVRCVREYSIEENKFFHADTLDKYRALGQEPPRFRRELRSAVTYNRRGDMMERETFGFAASKDVYTYAADGRKLCERRYRDGNLAREYVFVYDDRNRPVSAEATGPDGVIFREIYTDTDTVGGHILRCGHFSVSNPGAGDSESTVTYSADGRIKRMRQKSVDMLLDAELDDTEYPVRVTTRTASQTRCSEYVPEENLRYLYQVGEDGQRRLIGINTLDSHRNELSTRKLNADGEVTDGAVFSYEYDSHGNWLRRVRTGADGTAKVRVREIEYY